MGATCHWVPTIVAPTDASGLHGLGLLSMVFGVFSSIDDPDDASLQSWEDVGRLSDENYIG